MSAAVSVAAAACCTASACCWPKAAAAAAAAAASTAALGACGAGNAPAPALALQLAPAELLRLVPEPLAAASYVWRGSPMRSFSAASACAASTPTLSSCSMDLWWAAGGRGQGACVSERRRQEARHSTRAGPARRRALPAARSPAARPSGPPRGSAPGGSQGRAHPGCSASARLAHCFRP